MKEAVRRHWAPLAAAAAVLAVGALIVSATPFRMETDDLMYLALASSHAAGAGLTVPGEVPLAGTYFPPGWPLLLSWLFRGGLSLGQATLWASLLNLACLAAAAALWTGILRRRVGNAWALLAALWGTLAFPTLVAGTSASAEGLASLLTAVVALLAVGEGQAATIPASRRAGALGMVMAALALLRTQLVLLWLLALWHARKTLSRAQLAACLLVAAAMTAAVSWLAAPGAPHASYLALTASAWRGGLSSVGADTLRGNVLGHVWTGIAWLAASPLPYTRLFARSAGPLGLALMTALVCVGLAWAALRERPESRPPLAAAPLVLALPFVTGYPYAMSPRLLVPAAPILGFFAVALLRRALGRAPRLALAAAGVWLACGVVWWAHLAPRYRATQREIIADAEQTVTFLKDRGAWAGGLCAQAPEVLWAVAPGARSCRLVTTGEYLMPKALRDEAVGSRLAQSGARCVVGTTGQGSDGDLHLPFASWGFRLSFRTPRLSTWCRAPQRGA